MSAVLYRVSNVRKRIQDDDGFILYESRAIVWYIAFKYADQGTALIPSSLQGQALVQQALWVEVSHFNHWANIVIDEGVRKPCVDLAFDVFPNTGR